MIKMVILPKILFSFQTIPIIIGTKYFISWQRDLDNFIWQGKKARIKSEVMMGPKESGGFAVPNLRRYFEAACWSWIKNWILLKDTEVLMLEGWDKIYGWHGYLFYGKIKQHKKFTNHLIRKALFEVWERKKREL